VAARTVEVMRVPGWQEPAAAAIEVARDVESAQERHRLLVAAGGPYLLPVENRGTLGVDEQIGELLDVARISGRAGRRAVLAGFGDNRLAPLALPHYHI